MTLADMILAHSIIECIGLNLALELLDIVDGDTLLRPELHTHVERATRLLEHELGDDEEATNQLKTVLKDNLNGIQT